VGQPARTTEIEGQKVLASEGKGSTVLLAGGHAQLYSPERIRQPVDEGFNVVPVVNPSRFLYYSRMSPGVLSRIYHPEETRVDVSTS
jgi:hypothetical protein